MHHTLTGSWDGHTAQLEMIKQYTDVGSNKLSQDLEPIVPCCPVIIILIQLTWEEKKKKVFIWIIIWHVAHLLCKFSNTEKKKIIWENIFRIGIVRCSHI